MTLDLAPEPIPPEARRWRSTPAAATFLIQFALDENEELWTIHADADVADAVQFLSTAPAGSAKLGSQERQILARRWPALAFCA